MVSLEGLFQLLGSVGSLQRADASRPATPTCLLLAFPIIHGTVITQILLNRHTRFLVLLVRYAVAWFAATLMTLILLAYPAAAITGSLSTERSGAHIVLLACCSLALYVSLRRWGREQHITANSTVAPANPGS